ncbi:uncharacterized protein [Amphiura filiformis]|uniref:uncharacterized protein n=1 Tax=Amphiura filiformis TaxID=82378 RepID=UPI003B21FC63
MCMHLQYKYFEWTCCCCKDCCYTTDQQIINGNYKSECFNKNKECSKYATFSDCGTDGTRDPPEGTPPNKWCTLHGLTTEKSPTPTYTPTIMPTTILLTTQSTTSTPVFMPTTRPLTTQSTTGTPAHAPIGAATTATTDPGSSWVWTPAAIAGTVIGVVLQLAGVVAVGIMCPRYWKKRRHATSPSNGDLAEEEVVDPLISPSPSESSITIACPITEPHAVQGDAQISGNSQDDDVEAPMLSDNSNSEQLEAVADTNSTNASVHVLIETRAASLGGDGLEMETMCNSQDDDVELPMLPDNLDSEQLEAVADTTNTAAPPADNVSINTLDSINSETKAEISDIRQPWPDDSGFESGVSVHPSVESTPRQQPSSAEGSPEMQPSLQCIITPLSSICTKFVSEVHDKQALPDASVDSFEGLSSGKPDSINESFDETPQERLVSSLKSMQLSKVFQSYHAVGKVLKIVDGTSKGQSRGSRNSVTTLTDEESRDINEFIAIIENHPGFTRIQTAVQKDICMLKDLVKGNADMHIQTELQDIKDHLEKFKRKQEETNTKQEETNAKQEERNAAQDKINTRFEIQVDGLEEHCENRLDDGETGECKAPSVHIFELATMCMVLIECKHKYFKEVETSFQWWCDNIRCDRSCLGGSEEQLGIPRAFLLQNLKVNHSYKLKVKFEGLNDHVKMFKTTDEACTATFGDLRANVKVMAAIHDYVHCKGNGEKLRRRLACLTDREQKHRSDKWYRNAPTTVFEKLLQEREDFPLSILIMCLGYLDMKQVDDKSFQYFMLS